MKKGIKLISILISAALMLNIFPGTVFAAETNQTNIDAPQIGQSQKVKPKVLYEITSKREKNIKEFMTVNGAYLAAVYPSAVHYLDNGTWKDIDNSLVSAKDEYNNDILENKANSYKIKIAKSSKANNFVRIQKDKYELSWGIDNQNQVLSSVLDKVKDSQSTMDANVQLENINSNVQFKNIYQDIDFQYLIEPEKVKENIVINKNNGNGTFSYSLYVKNLSAKLNDDKSISFYDSSDSSKIVYKMEAPVMYDANGVSGNVDVSLTPTDNGYTLSITPDKAYLGSTDRVYPVTIDPPVSTDPGATSIYDSYVSASNPNINYYLAGTLKSGYTSTSGTFRSYVKFDIPDDLTNSSGNLVTQAYFYATSTSHTGSSASQVNIHEVTGTWDSTTITWNTKPAYNSSVEDYCMVQSPGNYEWDITRIAKKWLSSGVNNGVMFKDNSETTNYDEYYSSDCNINYESYRPKVIFYYTNNSGLEDYWTYHSSSAGRAGTGYVNDYNGNLVFVHDDFSLGGNLLPVNLQHIYNTNDKNISHGLSCGWKLNYYQEIAYTNISGNYYYVYTDGDGTKHYFACTDSQNGIYKDESGIGLTLVKNADSTYTITDKGNNKLKFTTSGYLSSITDSNSNTLSIAYTSSRISSITDGAGKVTSFSYNADYTLLQSITEPSTNKVISFEYTGNELTKITDPDGHYSTFTYDADGKMTSAVNYDGYKITYDYYTIKPYRVKTVQEVGTDSTNGQTLNIAYGENTTLFTDADNRTVKYEFNDSGNTMNVQDCTGGAQYYDYSVYDGDINNISQGNKLTSSSKFQKTDVNYLNNHNLEASTDYYWTSDYWTGSIGSSQIVSSNAYLGSHSILVSKTNSTQRQFMGQTLSLTKGQTYTLSGYVKANNVTNSNGKGACVFVNYQNSSGVWQTVDSKYINGTTTGWQRAEVTFTVPSDAASATVYARAGIVEESGGANFDCMQLETGKIANRYNIVENSDLTYSQSGVPVSWSKNSYCDSNDTALSAIQNDPGVPGIDRCAFKINGAASKTKALYQAVNVSGSAGDVFTIGGWAKGASVPQDLNRYFALDIGLKKTDGTYQWKVIYFNQDTDNWQYISGKVIANTNYTSIYYYLIYYDNANTAYFDGLQLYKEDFDTSYTYDTNGNPISVKELAQKNSTFEFTNNEVSKMIEPSGGSFTYSHDDTTHNITGATTAEGVKYSFTYDSHGNPITATVGDEDPAPHLTTTAGYTTSGNYMSSLTNPSGDTANYSYNETEGTLGSETDPNGHETSYAYDTMDNLSSVTKSAGGHNVSNSYTYENDDLKTITHNGFDFNFDYDHFGNVVSVSAAGTALSENTYDASIGNLTSTTYGSGNGPRTSYVYDSLDRITTQNYQEYNETSGVYETKLTYNYGYDANGNLGLVEDIANSVDYRYMYDLSDRIARIEDSYGNTTAFGYDDNSNGNSLSENISGTSYITGYVYEKDNRLKEADIYDGSKVTYSYDTLGRLSTATITSGTYNQQTTYNYNNEKLRSIVLPGGRTISYTYDNNGNILTINDTGNNKEIEYKYNELDELIRENNQVTGKTVIYAYDDGGNIQSKTEYAYTTDADPQNPTATHTYSYDTTWKDKLASYDGQAITYDNAGNPTNYNGLTFAWQNGNQLKSITGNGLDISYKYNYDGIRTEKTVNGTTTKYHLVNGTVTYETDGTDTIYYTYDNSGNILSMNINGTEYYYLKNAQGDIIGLTDSTGTQVVSYTYDSWGKLISIDGTLKDTVGVKNPYRYRSYRYDTETGLYYLQSRYYNPEWGRFINNDSIDILKELGTTNEVLTDANLYTYCGNNPVMNEDNDGNSWQLAFEGGTLGAYLGIGGSNFWNPIGWIAIGLGLFTAGTIGYTIYYVKRSKGKALRPQIKKQGRERGEKKKGNKEWKENPNKRPLDQPPHHTPSNRGHRSPRIWGK